MSTDAHANAFKTLVAAAAQVPAYDLDEVPGTPPANYVEVYLSRRFGGESRLDGSQDTTLRRLSTRVVASTVTNGRLLEDRIAAAFEHTTVNLGDTTVQVEYESGDGAFGYDEGSYTALTDWTFGI